MKIPKEKILSYVALAGQRYWRKKPPFDVCVSGQIDIARLGLEWCWIKLPPEHSSLGVEGQLLLIVLLYRLAMALSGNVVTGPSLVFPTYAVKVRGIMSRNMVPFILMLAD